MSDIFISYASADRARVKPLVEVLQREGWSVWWDRTIPPGKTWDEVIESAIRQARCVVVLWSKASVASECVRLEAHHGKQRRILIPAKIDGVEPPFAFQMIQAASLVDWRGERDHAELIELLREVESLVPRRVQAAAEPAPGSPVNPVPMPVMETPPAAPKIREKKVARPWTGHGRTMTFAAVGVLFIAGLAVWQPWRSGPAPKKEEARPDQPSNKVDSKKGNPQTVAVVEEKDKASTVDPKASQPAVEAKPEPKKSEAVVRQALPPAPSDVRTKIDPKDGLEYAWIPPGQFQMGCSPGDTECDSDEKPAHPVTITRGFWMGRTEVTEAAYNRSVGKPGGSEQMAKVNVNWDEAKTYCEWAGLRLPTEAEWEYAARAGSSGARYGALSDVAWYDGNSGGKLHPVAGKRANPWGLYDMLGNALEWVQDWYDEGYYKGSPSADPSGPRMGKYRTLRGGSWLSFPRLTRASLRDRLAPGDRNLGIGFRCSGEFRLGF
ncbi:MAG: SUMF1/EgtB/PvdO family nonheme iron enzyme [Bryobacterales bacterium]|nr:SUMF1/EgtB/PvdO family nonheme iron enzyme [Bryobacterales bacterium]